MNWWISAGAFDGFAPEEVRISWQIAAQSCWFRRMAFMKPNQPRFSPKRPKPDLRLLGHLVSGFHMIHPKYALVSQQNHCWCNFHMDRKYRKILCRFNDCDHFNRWRPISDNVYPILWWIREGQLRFEKLAQFSAVFSICRLNWGQIAHLEPRLKN